MLKRFIARILVVALLMQALPMQALAEVGDSLLVSPEELSRLVAQYAQGADGGDYHAGMAYSEHFSAYQLLGYLDELEGVKIEPLANTVEMLVNAVAKYRDSGPQQEITVGKLMTLDAFMFNLHAITDEVTACRNDLESAINYITSNADRVWDKENYSLTQRAGFSGRIKEAEADIERVRRTVSERHADWETGLENSEQAIRNDGNMDVQPSAANDGSYVTFTPRDSDKARGATRGGGWQLRDLYAELKPEESPRLYTVSAEELGLTRAPSLLERLSPVSTAYAAREQDATVTVIDDNQFALEARDENGNPIVGMIVRAIDVDKMYEPGEKQFVEVATDQNGAAVFDIPGNFTFDEFEQLNLYIEYPSGTGTLVRGTRNGENNDASGDAQPGYKEAHLWNVAVKRGSSFAFHTEQTNDPYLVSVAFDAVDITTTAETYFHSAITEAEHDLFVEVGNADLSTGKVRLRYVSAEPAKDENGNYILDPSTKDPNNKERTNYLYPTLETDAVSLTEKDGRLVATLKGTFLRDFKPHETVTLIYEDALHDAPFEFTLNLKIEESKGSPYKGTMKWLDFDTSSLFNVKITAPNSDWAGMQLGLDNPFNIPHASVCFTLDGDVFILVGMEMPDFICHGKFSNWPNTATPTVPKESTTNQEGPERPTQVDAEHAPQKTISTVNLFMNKKFTDIKDNWNALIDKNSASREKKLAWSKGTSLDVDVFLFGSAHVDKLGQKGDDGYISSTLSATIGVGLKAGVAYDVSYQWLYGFWGLTISGNVSFVFTGTLTEDILWKSWSDYKVTSSPLLQGPTKLDFTLYIKLQIEAYGGLGLKGICELSIHFYAYMALTFTWTIEEIGSDEAADTFRKKQPHIVIVGGFGLYFLFRFFFFRMRFDVIPTNVDTEWTIYNNWTEEDGSPDTWDKNTKNAVLATSEGRALPALAANAPAANADGAADDGEKQTAASDSPVYNDDILVDTTAPEYAPLVTGIEAQGGKVAYARISGGKYKNKDDTGVHTYAFFISTFHAGDSNNKMNGYPRLSYIDLDAPEPTVYTFDEDPYNMLSWDTSSTGLRNKEEEAKDTRRYDIQSPYDYDFAVASVADNNGIDRYGSAPLDGMSAIVCVLSSTGIEEAQVTDEATGTTMTVEQPSGSFYTTTFIATRADEKTGRLSMMISHSEEPHRPLYDVDVSCSKLVTDALWSVYGTPKDFQNPQVTAAFTNATFGPGPDGNEFNANVYEAVVTFQPPEKNREDSNAGWVLRYRTYAGNYTEMLSTVNDIYPPDDTDGLLLAEDRMQHVVLDRLVLPEKYWAKQDSNNQDVWVGDGQTTTFSVIPFKIDTSGFKDMWKDTVDYGPQISWLETRGFTGNEKAQFYHFYETKKDVMESTYKGWMEGATDWMPLSPADGSKLIGREGAGVSGHIAPWNADPDDEVAFFFYGDDEGRSYLDSVNLKNGVMTDYGFTAPAADMGCVDTEDSIIFYWFSSHEPFELENGQKGAGYALNTMLYEKASGVLFAPVVSAHVNAPDKGLSKPFMTEKGACYFAAEEEEPATDSGLHDNSAPARFSFYKFDQKYTMGVEFLDASFADGAVRQGAYDDINVRLRNNGNVPLSGFTMEVYNVTESGEEQLMETIVADLSHPENSTATYTGLADGNARTESGEQVVSVSETNIFRTRGEWAVVEATPTYPQGSEDDPDALPSGWDTKEAYLTTSSLIPNDQTTLTAPILIGADWKGVHKIRFRITQIVSSNDWAVDLEGNDLRQTRRALRAEQPRQVAVTRRSDGSSVLHYADQTPGDNPTWFRALLGAEEIEVPDNYNTDITFDDFELDTSSEDVTLHAREYTRPDGTQMVQLTAHNNAHGDGEDKCVVLFAYADYDQQNAWPVYDFGDLNAGSSVTLTLPLDLILNGHTANTLLLDLHIDHETARRSGTSGLLQSHRHDGSDLLNGCQHDRIAMDDVVKLSLGDSRPLQIDKQPVDQSILTGEEAAFAVDVTGGVMPYTFQWQARKPLLGNDGKPIYDEQGNQMYGGWEDLPEGASISLKLTATAEMNGWQFHVVVHDTVGSVVTSNFATLRLLDALADAIPKTGDDAHPLLWTALAIAALIAAIAVAAPRRRRRGTAR